MRSMVLKLFFNVLKISDKIFLILLQEFGNTWQDFGDLDNDKHESH